MDLSKRFQLHSTTPHSQKFVIICEADQRRKIGLMVDDIIGQQQVVIKSLEDNFHRIPGISGGTILGDGSIALILDIQELAEVMTSYEAA